MMKILFVDSLEDFTQEKLTIILYPYFPYRVQKTRKKSNRNIYFLYFFKKSL